jgi:alpha-tubulin suppressor-like RCC1 family protein
MGRLNMMTNIPAPAAPGCDWKQAAAGGCYSIALKSNGTLWAWGNNWAGSLGIGSTSNSAVPVQVGGATNWIKIWTGRLESVAMQSDGSLWYWGENPDPSIPQNAGQILVPTRISPDTNWVDVGFGDATVFAIKSDGTLWTWGRNAHVYTGASNQTLNATPKRIGTDSDWQNISACGLWWCQGLIKKDGSLWLMDASDGKPNGPRSPFPPVPFRRVTLTNDVVAFTAGSGHAPAPCHHVPIGAALLRNGEVWTWGMVLGEDKKNLYYYANQAGKRLGFKVRAFDPDPIFRKEPWLLPNAETGQVK